MCYDVCHQAVEFEDVAASVRALDAAGVRINKVHISCALQLDDPARNAEGRAALKQYVANGVKVPAYKAYAPATKRVTSSIACTGSERGK